MYKNVKIHVKNSTKNNININIFSFSIQYLQEKITIDAKQDR